MFELMKSKIVGKNIKIVFPEGEDKRVLEACYKLHNDKVLTPIIIGNREKINEIAKEFNGDFNDIEIIDMDIYDKTEMIDTLVELRLGKNTKEEVIEWLNKSNYFATMLVKMGIVAGLVGGATYSTGDTVKPSLQIIKTKSGVKKVSSAFVLVKENEKYIMGDCAINIAPTSEDIAATAVGCAYMARVFDIDPKVALLSFSSMGSASGEEVTKVSDAKKILDELNPDFEYDGELQFDAAFVESVGKIKAPNSKVAGHANTFIFPSLESGNISYKIAQRLGGFEAVGPLLIGLNAPVNDLSRGCNVDEIYKLAVITAVQSL
ncbi:MAG: phosphate acetyltransferase [Bacilli bacterium]